MKTGAINSKILKKVNKLAVKCVKKIQTQHVLRCQWSTI